MADFEFFAASVTRTALALNPLDLNDKINYRVSDQLLGGSQSWNRQTVKSPYVEGEFTVNRTRMRVDERFGVQVLGSDQLALRGNIAALIAAFSQDRFQLTLELDNAPQTYECEASDYQLDYTASRWMAKTVLVTFTMPRQPRLVEGVW